MTEAEHRVLRENLGCYALDKVSESDAWSLRRHLACCGDCADELAQIQTVAGHLRSVHLRSVHLDHLGPAAVPPESLGEAIISRVGQERRSRDDAERPRLRPV